MTVRAWNLQEFARKVKDGRFGPKGVAAPTASRSLSLLAVTKNALKLRLNGLRRALPAHYYGGLTRSSLKLILLRFPSAKQAGRVIAVWVM